jgi:hypothetical protein
MKKAKETIQLQEDDSEITPEGYNTSKRFYIMAILLSVILIAAIGALAISLVRLRQEDSSDEATSLVTSGNIFTKVPVETQIPASPAFVPESPVASPSQTAPTREPISPPVQEPTAPSVTADQQAAAQAEIQQIIFAVSPNSIDQFEDVDSPQHRAFEWLASDPNFSDYDESRIIQRWVLAMFSLSLPIVRTTATTRTENSWISYANECTWASSSPDRVCNDEGQVESIDFREGNLEGTLPVELTLLSNSLSKFAAVKFTDHMAWKTSDIDNAVSPFFLL